MASFKVMTWQKLGISYTNNNFQEKEIVKGN